LGPKTRTKIRKHRAIFRVLWRNFKLTASACLANGGRVAIEWPKACMYWRDKDVKAALRRWGCMQHHLDGCMYGLTSQAASTSGKLLRKPWTIASNADGFMKIRRPCDHKHEHAKTQGVDTKLTEGYTPALADAIHHCWYISVGPGSAGGGRESAAGGP